MIIQIEGSRKAGKTWLTEELKAYCFSSLALRNRVHFIKFPFSIYFDQYQFNKKSPEAFWLTLGKELQLINLAGSGVFNDKIIVCDRGLITTFVWANIEERVSITNAYAYFMSILSQHQNALPQFIHILGKDVDRPEKDKWDDADNSVERKAMRDFFNLAGRYARTHEFENTYTPESAEQFIRMFEGIINPPKEIL